MAKNQDNAWDAMVMSVAQQGLEAMAEHADEIAPEGRGSVILGSAVGFMWFNFSHDMSTHSRVLYEALLEGAPELLKMLK